MKLSVLGNAKMLQTRKVSPKGSIVTRLALHFSMLEVAPSAKTVVTCSKARLATAVVHVVLYRKACVVPLHSPKSLLTLGFSEVTRWDHSKFSSFHYIKLVTYPMICMCIIYKYIRTYMIIWYYMYDSMSIRMISYRCELLDYPSLSKTCSRLGSLSLSRQVPWITTVVYHPLEAADGGDGGFEARGYQRIDMPYWSIYI